MSLRVLGLLTTLLLVLPGAARAQTDPGPPGPFVIDLRGAMIGLPNAGEFYPALPEDTTIPGRAFGFDLGAHVLFGKLGAGRMGVGANASFLRGKVGPPDVSARVTTVAPQFSLNFGSGDGWSYLSAGYGLGSISTRVAATEDVEETRAETGMVGTLNFGGGARWFVNRHVATGFDVRFHRFSASSELGTPATMRVALSVGVSLR
ncbi:MAG: hypothetical protein ABL986_20890 [Vicinamibacterales bacterium]